MKIHDLEQERRRLNRRFPIVALTALVVVALLSIGLMMSSPALAGRATQIAGIGFFAEPGECFDPAGQSADFALKMTGDLQGCHYVFVETAECSPSGTYKERGTELFVGQYTFFPLE